MFQVISGSCDSHFHVISMEKKNMHVENLLKDLFASGLDSALDVGVDGRDWERRRAFAQEFPQLFLAEGIHPHEAGTFAPRDLGDLQARWDFSKTLACGEIGLDWHYGRDREREQKELFAAQLQWAQKLNLPVIIHNREADREIVDLIRSEGFTRGGVFHCFSSTYETAAAGLDLGFSISFAGNLTYPKSLDIQEAARRLPWDRILVETDAPYLAPQPVRGKLNHTGYLEHTIRFLADLKGTSPEAAAEKTRTNFRALFNLPE